MATAVAGYHDGELSADERPVPRPLGLGDLLFDTFGVYRRGWKPLLTIAALTYGGYMVLQALVHYLHRLMCETPEAGFVLAVGETIPSAVLWLMAEAAFCVVASAVYLGQRPQVARACRLAFARSWPLARLGVLTSILALSLLLGCAAGASTPALWPLVLVGMGASAYWLVRWSLAAPALVLEDRTSLREGLRRSSLLLRGGWWRAAVVTLGFGIVTCPLLGIAAQQSRATGYGVGMLLAPIIPIVLTLL